MNKHNHQKKLAFINDLSGFGRCSIAAALPIVSHLKVQCCVLPTSIFSAHTGFEGFKMTDFTQSMSAYMDHWKELGLSFSGICSGFLGSKEQIELVIRFIEMFRQPDTIVIIDPVMGDDGHPYPTYTHEMCQEMKRLIAYANILTPNITEACILTDTPYKERWKTREIIELAQKLSDMGPEKVVITGIVQKSYLGNLCYEKGRKPMMRKMLKIGQQRSGTGDVFTSIIAADAINQVPFEDSVKKAGKFIQKCMEASQRLQIPRNDGVAFEEVLHTLK